MNKEGKNKYIFDIEIITPNSFNWYEYYSKQYEEYKKQNLRIKKLKRILDE